MDIQTPFSKVAESRLAAKAQLVKRSTYCAYALIIKTHLLPAFKDRTTIQETEAQKFVIDKLNSGLKRKTVKDILATLRAIIRHGEKYYNFPGERWEIVLPTDSESKALPTLSLPNHKKLLNFTYRAASSVNLRLYKPLWNLPW